MWACYLAGAALYAGALRSGHALPPRPRAAALGTAAAGVCIAASGMRRFASAAQITGTAGGPLVTASGVYRFSRNPQYVGTVLAGAAVAVATRSTEAAAVTAAYAGVCRWWIPIEERSLAARHGAGYDAYCARVSRWFRWPQAPTGPG